MAFAVGGVGVGGVPPEKEEAVTEGVDAALWIPISLLPS